MAYKNPDDQKQYIEDWNLRKKYGVTLKQKKALLHAQGGGCAICGGEANALDHCHDTGIVRGVLCRLCNLGLGFFKDDPDLLRSAICYLGKSHVGLGRTAEAVLN